MQAKTYVGKILVRIGEYDNDVTLLVVANSDKAAWDVLEGTAQCYYGDDDTPEENDGYYANDGEIFTQAKSLSEVGLSTFLDLKPYFMVRRQTNVTPPDETALEAPLSELAQSLTSALNRKVKVVSHSQVLNAVASAYGYKNWNVLRTKLEALEPTSNANFQPAAAVADSEQVDPNHVAWMEQEFQRVGMEKIRFIQGHGYSILENGSRNSWYATSPTMQLDEDDFGNQDYLSVFPTLDELVKELLEKLGGTVDEIPDELALALCWVHNLSVLKHKQPVRSSVWFSPDIAEGGSFATAGEAARAALAAKGIKHNTHPSFHTGSLYVKRRYIAELLYDAFDFNSEVEASNGWEDSAEDCLHRTVFLRQKEGDTLKVTFRVSFKRGSAEAEGRSVA